MTPNFQKLYSLPSSAESIFTSTASNTVIIEAGNSLYTPQGIIDSIKSVSTVRITADGAHWIATLRMIDDRYALFVDGKDVATFEYIHGACAAISDDGKRWAVFADTERGENCLVIDGIIYGPYLAAPPGTGFNTKPLQFDANNALWCPVKIDADHWVLSRDGEVNSEPRELWRDIEFQSGCMKCRSRKDGQWFVHAKDQEWGPFESAESACISSNQQHLAFAAKMGKHECVISNGEIIHRDKRVMMDVQVTDDGKVLAAITSERVEIDFSTFYNDENEYNAEEYERATEAYLKADHEAAQTTRIHFGNWISQSFKDCSALALSENGQHFAFIADRHTGSFAGNQTHLWGPFDNILHMQPLALNNGSIAWVNQYDDHLALCIDGIEIAEMNAVYGKLREIENGLGFIAVKGDEVFWVSVEWD